ncbi:Hypothetical_protein [Hexamita inflata]|uniref:Hypothetical_protein n=1 Tax=Hexamita inflata TaxID=28002 RepID=A0ABP1IKH3_9EUKA
MPVHDAMTLVATWFPHEVGSRKWKNWLFTKLAQTKWQKEHPIWLLGGGLYIRIKNQSVALKYLITYLTMLGSSQLRFFRILKGVHRSRICRFNIQKLQSKMWRDSWKSVCNYYSSTAQLLSQIIYCLTLINFAQKRCNYVKLQKFIKIMK